MIFTVYLRNAINDNNNNNNDNNNNENNIGQDTDTNILSRNLYQVLNKFLFENHS